MVSVDVPGPPLVSRNRQVEQLEGLDRTEQQRQQQQAADIGEGDRAEPAPPGGAVDLGGLVEIFRHADQAGEDQQHDERRPHPGIGEDDAGHGARRRLRRMKGSPVNSANRLAEQAEGRLVVVAEEGADRDEGEHHRRQHQDQQIAAQRETACSNSRASRKPTTICDGDGQHDDERRGLQAVPDDRVGQRPSRNCRGRRRSAAPAGWRGRRRSSARTTTAAGRCSSRTGAPAPAPPAGRRCSAPRRSTTAANARAAAARECDPEARLRQARGGDRDRTTTMTAKRQQPSARRQFG